MGSEEGFQSKYNIGDVFWIPEGARGDIHKKRVDLDSPSLKKTRKKGP